MNSSLAIRFGTLHDQLGEAKRNGVLIIEGERVARVGGPETQLPANTPVVEAVCVVPGLINAHAHLEASGEAQTANFFKLTTPTQRALLAARNAREALHAGVTSLRDLGSTESIAIDVRDAIAAGTIAGPNVVAAGRAICMTGGHGRFIGREADGECDVRKAVREQLRAGADCIKFIATGGVLTQGAVPGGPGLDEAELRAGISEAHAHGMRCAAHAIGAAGIVRAHLVDDQGIQLFLERGARLVPTLAAIRCIVSGGTEAGMPDFVVRKAREIDEHAERNLRRALAAGVRFAGGSDAGTPFNGHEAYAYELELMQSMLGMSPHDVLHATTVQSAAVLGIARGTLGAGDVADLVVLAHAIDSDARPYREPVLVIKSGAIVAP